MISVLPKHTSLVERLKPVYTKWGIISLIIQLKLFSFPPFSQEPNTMQLTLPNHVEQKKKRKIENEVVRWRHMEEARRLEVQVMAGGDRSEVEGDEEGLTKWEWERRRRVGRRLRVIVWNGNMGLGFLFLFFFFFLFFLTFIYIWGYFSIFNLTLRFWLRWMLLLRHTILGNAFFFRHTLFFCHLFFFWHTLLLRQAFLFW